MAKKILKIRIDCPTEELFDKVSPWLKEYWSKEVINTGRIQVRSATANGGLV